MFAKTTKEDLRYDDEKDPPLANQLIKKKTVSTRESTEEAEALDYEYVEEDDEEDRPDDIRIKNTAIQQGED